MITQVSYERVFNLGNYENHRISASATVENGDYVAAFANARSAVEAQHVIFEAERTAERERREIEWRQKAAVRALEWQQSRNDSAGAIDGDDEWEEDDDDQSDEEGQRPQARSAPND